MPSSHLILYHPLLLLPPIPPSIRVFSNESTLHMRWPRTGVSALASVLPKNIQDRSPLEWTGWISLQPKGLSRVFSNTTVQKHQFFGAQLGDYRFGLREIGQSELTVLSETEWGEVRLDPAGTWMLWVGPDQVCYIGTEEHALVEAGPKHLTQLGQPRLFGWSGVTGVGSITPSAVACSNIRMIYCRKQFSRQSWSLSMCWGSIQCKKPLRPPYLVAMGKRSLGEISHAGAPEKWLWISEVRSEEECMCVKETENSPHLWRAWGWIFYHIIFISLYCQK